MSVLTMETASRIPATPPAAESSRLSVINWRTMRARLDPMARRMAISFCRAAARAVSKLARFAQAMSKTSAVTPMRTSSGFSYVRRRLVLPCAPGITSNHMRRKLDLSNGVALRNAGIVTSDSMIW